MNHAGGCGANEDDPERERGGILLELDATVHRDEDVVIAAHLMQEVAVPQTSPATADDGIYVVPLEL